MREPAPMSDCPQKAFNVSNPSAGDYVTTQPAPPRLMKFLGRCSRSTGPNRSRSNYFPPRIEWLQAGSRILFGKVYKDCVYILIDTSHSMKGKLDLVKDKIIRFMQVR